MGVAMNVDELPETVWVVEAYNDGERVEQIVHLTREDAKEDIFACTEDAHVDEHQFNEKRLYTGQVDEL